MRSLLFIGGTGFLGQSFFDCLNRDKLKKLKLSHIYIISRNKKKIKSKVKISFINKNIKDINQIPITDYIIYAANSKNYKENLDAFFNFKKLLNKDFKKTKIIFTSSGAVYGPRKIQKKMKEIDLVNTSNINNFKGYKKNYAKSKIIMEAEFKKLSQNGFKISIARLFSFIGEKILINKNFAISNLIAQTKQKKIFLKLNDNKKVYRSYMHSDDLIEWLSKILISSSNKFEIYNVGSDEIVSIENLAKMIGIKNNKKIIKKKYINKNIDFYVPSIIKAKRKLNLNIKFKIKDSINFLLKNINDYKN